MDRWRCNGCGYIYDLYEGDPDNGIEPGTEFEELPDYWECPECGASRMKFELFEVEEELVEEEEEL